MNTTGFFKKSEARKFSPVVIRADLVAERNAALKAKADTKESGESYLAKNRTDSRVKCFRPNGTCYAILSAARWRELRDKKQLQTFLDGERTSGVILQTR